jgi:hypothetical protein
MLAANMLGSWSRQARTAAPCDPSSAFDSSSRAPPTPLSTPGLGQRLLERELLDQAAAVVRRHRRDNSGVCRGVGCGVTGCNTGTGTGTGDRIDAAGHACAAGCGSDFCWADLHPDRTTLRRRPHGISVTVPTAATTGRPATLTLPVDAPLIQHRRHDDVASRCRPTKAAPICWRISPLVMRMGWRQVEDGVAHRRDGRYRSTWAAPGGARLK